MNLKVDDEIDCMTAAGKWHRSTVVKAEERVVYEQPIIKVGFRYYHCDGENKDNEGKSYFGLPEALDENIGAYSCRVEKVKTKSLDAVDKAMQSIGGGEVKKTAAKNLEEKKDDQDKKDLEMLETEGEIIYATERNNCSSTCLVTLLTKFG